MIDTLELDDNPRQKARKPEYQGAGALAKLLDVDRVTVTRWLDGDRSPEYTATMQMLQLAGWLNIDGGVLGEAQSPQALQPDIQTAMAQLLLGQAEGLEYLARIEQALVDAPSGRKRAAQRKSASQRGQSS